MNRKGFTLVELMIVIAIIGILAAIAIPQFVKYMAKKEAREWIEKGNTQISQIKDKDVKREVVKMMKEKGVTINVPTKEQAKRALVDGIKKGMKLKDEVVATAKKELAEEKQHKTLEEIGKTLPEDHPVNKYRDQHMEPADVAKLRAEIREEMYSENKKHEVPNNCEKIGKFLECTNEVRMNGKVHIVKYSCEEDPYNGQLKCEGF